MLGVFKEFQGQQQAPRCNKCHQHAPSAGARASARAAKAGAAWPSSESGCSVARRTALTGCLLLRVLGRCRLLLEQGQPAAHAARLLCGWVCGRQAQAQHAGASLCGPHLRQLQQRGMQHTAGQQGQPCQVRAHFLRRLTPAGGNQCVAT